MARSRTIKPTFFTNEELAELPRDVRLFFIGLWGIADREGRLENRPKRIKREVFPYDDDVTTETVESWLTLLANHKSRFVSLYEVDGEQFIQVKNFKKHQDIHPRETASVIPGQPKANLGAPSTEPAVARPEIIPLPSLPSLPSCTSEPSSTLELSPARDPGAGTTEPRQRAEARVKSEAIEAVFAHYRSKRPKSFPRVHSGLKEWRLIRERIVTDGRTAADLCKCIDGYWSSQWHQGNNDRKTKYLDLELFMRDEAHVAKGIELAESSCGPGLFERRRDQSRGHFAATAAEPERTGRVELP